MGYNGNSHHIDYVYPAKPIPSLLLVRCIRTHAGLYFVVYRPADP